MRGERALGSRLQIDLKRESRFGASIRRSSQSSIEAALAAYDAARRPPTAAIVLANRKGGPDRVLQLAEERAPNGFSNIEEVIPRAELESIAQGYKQTAGFDREAVNRRSGKD